MEDVLLTRPRTIISLRLWMQLGLSRFASALCRNDAAAIGDHMPRNVASHEPLEIDAGRVLVLMHSNQKPIQVLKGGIHCCYCSAGDLPPVLANGPLS